MLFSSEGMYVYDSLRVVMPGGNLNACNTDSGSWARELYRQPVAIAPAPGSDFEYYVFYWSGATTAREPLYTLTWARVDMRQNGGRGAVTDKGHQLTRIPSPHVTAVRHANNRDFWVITRTSDSRGFQVFLLNRDGVNPTPVVSLLGQTQYPDDSDLKAAPNGRRLACGAVAGGETTGEGLTCVYDFDNATGQVSNEMVLHRTPLPRVYTSRNGRLTGETGISCSFSPDARLLYAIEPPTPAAFAAQPRRGTDVWQYDLGRGTPAAIAATRWLVSNAPVPPAAVPLSSSDFIHALGLQLAPDGTVWVGQFYYRQLYPYAPTRRPMAAAIIRRPNVAGAGCGFEPEGYFYRYGQQFWSAFPNVITNMLYAPPVLNHEVGCAGDSVQFWASSAGLPASLRWDFGDPGSGPANAGSGRQVAHRYPRGGTYLVRLTLADGRVLTQTITVPSSETDFSEANIFTPNADGLNDTFRPVLRGEVAGGARLQVFSRWGQRLFEATAPAPQWDGAGAVSGDYFYYLDYADCQGNPRHRRGILTLRR